MSFFKNFDFFSHSPVLRISGDKRYKSTFGGQMTIIVLIITILLFLLFFIFQMIINRTGVVIAYDDYQEKFGPQEIHIQGTYFFAFYAFDSNYNEIVLDPNYFNLSLVNIYQTMNKGNITTNQKAYSSNFCDFNTSNTFTQKISNTKYKPICFNPSKIKVGGDLILMNEFYQTSIHIQPIDRIKNGPLLKEYISQVNKILSIGMTVGFYTPRTLNISHPYQFVTRSFYLEFNKTYQMTLKMANMTSYKSYLPEGNPDPSESNSMFSSLDQGVEFISPYSALSVNLVMDVIKFNVERRYYTIDFFVAKFVSLLNLAIFFLQIINSIVVEKAYYLYLINKFFRVEGFTEKKINIKSNKTYFEVEFVKKNEKDSTSDNETYQLSKRLKNYAEVVKRREFRPSKLKLLFCPRNAFSLNYKDYTFKINNIMSFESILNTVTDMRKFKKLILNDDQIKIFDYYYADNYISGDFGNKPGFCEFRENDFGGIHKNYENEFEQTMNIKILKLLNEEMTQSGNF